MLPSHGGPTPYPDVNALLDRILSGARRILGPRFVGMYLYGSLAYGHFDPRTSDVDFLVVSDGEVPDDLLPALAALHDQIAESERPLAHELEGAYISRQALRRYDPANARHPHIDRGVGERLAVRHFDADWVVQRVMLREYGVTVAGPPPRTLIDPVAPDELRAAVATIVRDWWAPMADDPTLLRRPGYQGYAVLTMCRMLYTLDHGTILAKPVAARWAQESLDPRWRPLIERALRQELGPDDLAETQALIRLVARRCEAPG